MYSLDVKFRCLQAQQNNFCVDTGLIIPRCLILSPEHFRGRQSSSESKPISHTCPFSLGRKITIIVLSECCDRSKYTHRDDASFCSSIYKEMASHGHTQAPSPALKLFLILSFRWCCNDLEYCNLY